MKWWYEQYSEADQYHYDAFYRRAKWDEKFLWLPQLCNLTGRRLWLTWVHRATSIWTGPGDPVVEHHYHDKKQHILWALSR